MFVIRERLYAHPVDLTLKWEYTSDGSSHIYFINETGIQDRLTYMVRVFYARNCLTYIQKNMPFLLAYSTLRSVMGKCDFSIHNYLHLAEDPTPKHAKKMKDKGVMCLTNQQHATKDVWGSGGVTPTLLKT